METNPMQNQNTPASDLPISPAPAGPVESKSKKRFNLKFWIPASVVVVLALVGIWLYGQYIAQLDNNIATSMNNATHQTITASPSTTPDPTAGWKTYTNNQYGFEFKYPNSYPIPKEYPRSSGTTQIASNPVFSMVIGEIAKGYCEGSDCYTQGIEIYPKMISDNWLQSIKESSQFKGGLIKIISDNIQSGSRIIVFEEGGIDLSKNAIIFGTQYSSRLWIRRDVTNFDQILSTFKFIPLESARP